MKFREINEGLFFAILIWSGYQDYRTRGITERSLAIFGVIGSTCSVLLGRTWSDVILSCGVGIGLLIISRVTKEAIGEGDGWFFIVSGLFLNWQKNMVLFLTGLGFCFLVSLPVVVIEGVRGKTQKRSLPFLTFLIPAWMFLY